VRFCPPEPTGERGRIAVVDEAGRRFLTVLFPAGDRRADRAKGRIRKRINRRVEAG
jgi:hypothetical protein